MSKDRNVVGTYRKKGTFRRQAADRSGRAAQNTDLPPRCDDCRLPGTITTIVDGVAHFHCSGHWVADHEGE